MASKEQVVVADVEHMDPRLHRIENGRLACPCLNHRVKVASVSSRLLMKLVVRFAKLGQGEHSTAW